MNKRDFPNMRCISTEQLNIAAEDPEKIISDGERYYFEQLSMAEEKIYASHEKRPVVLISGPSGSGKTTSAHRIADLLAKRGCKAHIISMDNYFLSMSENEAALDFESPYSLDIPLFKKHLKMLSQCEEIDIPAFDFAKQERYEGTKLKREPNDLVILEGIHALNPIVTGDCEDYTTCVYVSVRTRISNGEKLLHPSKIRLMRRLIRDKLFRGRDIDETFEFFKSVERGEDLYILPFKERASISIDTFIEYEANVYRDMLLTELEAKSSEQAIAKELAEFLKLLKPIEKKFVPQNSLIREFVGD